MTKRAWLNLGLLALVAGLAWVAWQEPGKEVPAARTHLTPLTPDQVTQIFIQRPGKEDLLFAKDRVWSMRLPFQVPANQLRIDSILSLTRAEWRGQFDVAGLDLAKYKLDKPLARIEFDDIAIDFGGNEPLNRHRYVRMGQYVYLINDTLFYQMLGEPEAFVSLALLPPGSSLVDMRLPDLTLANEQGRWVIGAGRINLSPDQIDRLVDEWQHAQAIRVARHETAAAQGEIVLRLSDGSAELRFAIIQRDPELILVREDIGLAYYFTAEQAKRLLPVNTVDPVPVIAE